MAKLGKPLNLTNDQLDEAAEITEKDLLKTQKRWEKTANRWAKNLLLAEVE